MDAHGRAVFFRNSAFQSAGTGRRSRGWNTFSGGPNDSTLPSLSLLRDRSRQAVRNDGWAAHALDELVDNLVGTGITPLSVATDQAFAERVDDLWDRWTYESDPEGVLDFYGQQSLATRSWLEAGEVFVRHRFRFSEDGLTVPLQVQIIEAEYCPITHNAPRGANKIRAGIEFSPIGRRAAYWFYRARPGDTTEMDSAELVRVNVETVRHIYDPARPGQIRGLPRFTQALVHLRDLDLYDDATLQRQQLANMMVAFVKRASAPAGDLTNPLDGKAIEKDEDPERPPLMPLEPGLFQELAYGEEIQWSEPPDAGDTYEVFMRQQLRKIAASVGLPYELLTGDLMQISDRTVRVIINEFRRAIERRQEQIVAFQFCQPIWEAWFTQAVISGALPVPDAYYTDPRPFRRVEWTTPAWAYIQPVQDAQADEIRIRSGLTTRTRAVRERGYDVRKLDKERAADDQRADELKLVFDSDPRKTDASGKRAGAAGEDPAPGEPERPERPGRTRERENSLTGSRHA